MKLNLISFSNSNFYPDIMLYPLKFEPIYKYRIWGGEKLKKVLNKKNVPDKTGESWEISGVQDNLSVVANGSLKGNSLQELSEIYMGDLLGDKVYEKFGDEFPLLIKLIDANDVLSIQVHPDDQLAEERHNAYGKTEMWYVIQADENSSLYSGFRKKINREEYLSHLENKTIKDVLNEERVKAGDVFFIPAGRVHATGAGILFAEIQQTSDITYRIYDWDRIDKDGKARELHTELALDAIDFEVYQDYKTKYSIIPNSTIPVESCQYFTTNIIRFDREIIKDYYSVDSFIIYICLEGSFSIRYKGNMEMQVNKGETVLLPASLNNIKLVPNETTEILEVYIP